MKLFNKLYAPLLGIIICIFVFLKANTGQFIGIFINQFFPCVQDPKQSYPCYGHYDVSLMLIALILGVILISVFILQLFKFYKNSR
ncbi:hypothetical protein KKG24_05250 [Patescibacteria group bacterium]|nr:hypothetical protein [Patescibacteria group bacterium]